MSPHPIATLTPEQEALIPVYRDKWRAIALSTQPSDRVQAEAAIKRAYAALGKKEPQVRFFSSPNTLRLELLAQSPRELTRQLGAPLLNSLALELYGQIQEQLEPQLIQQLHEQLQPSPEEMQQMTQVMALLLQQLERQLLVEERNNFKQVQELLREELLRYLWEEQEEQMRSQVRQFPGGEFLLQLGDSFRDHFGEPLWHNFAEPAFAQLSHLPWVQEWERNVKEPLLEIVDAIGMSFSLLRPSADATFNSLVDYCISVLKCDRDASKWTALQLLSVESGWNFPFEKTCLVCDRPQILCFDERDRLHAEGQPAVRFADGYALYAYRGVLLPDRYAAVHPNLWQGRWLLEEPNAELRRVLIQGIGYARLCQELQAVELDSWREYTLLRIENDIDVEAIYLLKMICPSTGYIHALRVPPTMRSAREAISWVNHGIDPEEFSAAT
jgi:hypothetical protein